MTDVQSIDPRTGQPVEVVTRETTPDEVDRLAHAAALAAPGLDTLGRDGRGALLRALADGLEARRADIVGTADRETALGVTRLNGELTRTCYQFRLFAEVLEEGSYLEAAIDHAGDSPMGPRPDLRRMLVPLGPVAVFGASNFPLAFSVPGGDTASALAAGSPVVVKAHGAHPATSQLCFDVMSAAAAAAGAPAGTLGVVHGVEAGVALVQHPAIRAVGFTGSLAGGQAIVRLIDARPDPIPFYGELSSLNPVVVTSGAAVGRAEEIGRGLGGSMTLGSGQFCTKPGLAFVPVGPAGDRLIEAMSEFFDGVEPHVLLSERIARSYAEDTDRLASTPGMTTAARGGPARGVGYEAVPLLLSVDAGTLPRVAHEEVFGPVAVVARYADEAELLTALDGLPASLTMTVHTGAGHSDLTPAIVRVLGSRSGRLLFNGYPTGVAVTWAQHHGGPWPSTNTAHTSVGTSAIRRFLRPVAWQSAPRELLPVELRDEEPGIPRRVDGVLVLPARS
ncbi:aldehyde dehydrogenase (NADP(+)) [Blastococcus saxobsidens]|uniref:NADP-dependent aldehyde dehydrogenase n=1 Tax=Blastococcus saxobsidens TaxID=138336 RepID=A0A4Q7Y8A2_9ACTN|nr:aldehyde dehydrogenase (NADP(+)) [Blastococcus saxobsidens]RZU32215.1 NADP-dependent aldehyde dehydrogenase [Blastococcus saxobsidens]